MPLPPDSLYSFSFLAFVGLSSNRPNHASAWANKDVLDFDDFAHDKGGGVFE
jgi:hypothetical protein